MATGLGTESPLSFEHQVAYGGPGGSPYATERCVAVAAVNGTGVGGASAATGGCLASIGASGSSGLRPGEDWPRQRVDAHADAC
jgi:hypothetical protein